MLKARPRWNANTGLGGFANMGRRLGASALVKLCAVVGLVLLGVPADSLAPPERVCGDGKCQNPENSETCPADCGSGGGGDPEPELACNILDSTGNHFCDLAFVAKLNNKNQGIYLSADDGSGLVKLLEHVVPGLGARWLPDGDRVAFTDQNAELGQVPGVYTINILTGDITLVAPTDSFLESVYPDPVTPTIVYSQSVGSTTDLFLALETPPGSDSWISGIRLTSTSLSERSVHFSPDGSRMVLSAGGVVHIYDFVEDGANSSASCPFPSCAIDFGGFVGDPTAISVGQWSKTQDNLLSVVAPAASGSGSDVLCVEIDSDTAGYFVVDATNLTTDFGSNVSNGPLTWSPLDLKGAIIRSTGRKRKGSEIAILDLDYGGVAECPVTMSLTTLASLDDSDYYDWSRFGGRSETLRWLQSDLSNVAGFMVYVGAASGTYGPPVDVAMANPEGADIFRYDLEVPAGDTVYVAVTAYSESRLMSSFSNEQVRGP